MTQIYKIILSTWKFIFSMASINKCYAKNMETNYGNITENATNPIIHGHHLIRGSRIITLEKLRSTERYSILILKVQNKFLSNIYCKNLFNQYIIDWAAIYMLWCLVIYNIYMQSFQCKILIPICNLKQNTKS